MFVPALLLRGGPSNEGKLAQLIRFEIAWALA